MRDALYKHYYTIHCRCLVGVVRSLAMVYTCYYEQGANGSWLSQERKSSSTSSSSTSGISAVLSAMRRYHGDKEVCVSDAL
jgi:hypothetical protein